LRIRRSWLLWLTPLLFSGALFATSSLWLPSLGSFLVEAGEPVKSDVIVVLAGDWWGLRVEKGGELVRAGFAPTALVSGPPHYYGRSEADLAIDWAVRRGYSREYFTPVRVNSSSTEDEAAALADEIRKRSPAVRTVLVVTSSYHTRRAARLWRKAARGDFEVRTVAATDKDLKPETWWATREGRKKIFFEWIKTITGPFGV
jgi:uncharacterized SAM-binding protein YcdF (DUF218 family)